MIDDGNFVCLLDHLILGFCNSNLIPETGGCELASAITLVFQANQPAKCASNPKIHMIKKSGIFMFKKGYFLLCLAIALIMSCPNIKYIPSH